MEHFNQSRRGRKNVNKHLKVETCETEGHGPERNFVTWRFPSTPEKVLKTIRFLEGGKHLST